MKKRVVSRGVAVLFFALFMWTPHAYSAEAKNIFKTDDELLPLIQRASTSNDSDDSVLYLLWEDRYTFENKGVGSITHRAAKVLKKSAMQDFDHFETVYNGKWEDLDIKIARTIAPDGTVYNVSKEFIRYTRIYPDSSEYQEVKKLYIPFSAVTEGSIVEFKIEKKVEYRNVGKEWLLTFFSIPPGYNIMKVSLEIDWPDSLPGIYMYKGFEKNEVTTEEKNGRKKISIITNNYLIPHAYEIYRPPYKEIGPYAVFSVNKSWDSFYEVVAADSNKLLRDDPAIAKKAIEIIEKNNAKTKNEKIKALYEFVNQEIRYLNLSFLPWGGYDTDAADLVLKNKYADCKGMSALLISLLKAVDIPAYFAPVPPYETGDIDKDVPGNYFNHVITAIPENGAYTFLDPTASFSRYPYLPAMDQGVTVLILGKDKYELVKTPITPPVENKTLIITNIGITDDGGLDCKQTEEFSGVAEGNTRFWYAHTGENVIKDQIGNKLSKEVSGSVLKSVENSDPKDMSKPFLVSLDISIPKCLTKIDDLAILSLPVTNFVDPAMVAANTRAYDIKMPYLYEVENEVRVLIPDGYIVKTLPKEMEIDLPYLYFKGKFHQEGRFIVGNKKFIIKERVIPVSGYDQINYKQFKEAIKKCFEMQKENIVLAKEK